MAWGATATSSFANAVLPRARFPGTEPPAGTSGGRVVEATETVKVAVSVFPEASVAVMVTRVLPGGKRPPLACE